MLYVEIGTVFVLIVVNGLLAMSELAIVSSRPARLKTMIDRNVRGAGRALELSANPGRFLSTVQIGITLVGVLSGAFSGATLGAAPGRARCVGTAFPRRVANALGVGIVVALITYGSLIIGELVPKQIALRNPEGDRGQGRAGHDRLGQGRRAAGLAARHFRPRRAVAAWPARRKRGSVTDEEIKMLVAEAEHHGTIESDERRMIAGVMRLGDRAVRAVMTPRTEVDWIEPRVRTERRPARC